MKNPPVTPGDFFLLYLGHVRSGTTDYSCRSFARLDANTPQHRTYPLSWAGPAASPPKEELTVTTYQHPGAYVQEIPGARSILGASTSETAFIGVAESGPCDSPQPITSWDAFTRQFGNPTWNSFMPWAVYAFFQEGGTCCHIVRVKQTDTSQGTAAATSIGNMTLSAASMGAWGNRLQVFISGEGANPAPAFTLSVVVPDSVLNSAELPDDQATQLLIAYVKQNNLAITSINGQNYVVLESFSGFTSADASLQTHINTTSMFIRATLTDSALALHTATPMRLSGGKDPAWDFSSALDTLAAIPTLSLLAMPDTVGVIHSDGATDSAAQRRLANKGLRFCETLQSLFYVIDPPYGLDVSGILAFKDGTARTNSSPAGELLDSQYGALYCPWVWVFHPRSNTNVPMPPSGPVLGRYVTTDLNTGVWKAPAGVSDGALQTVTALFAQLTDADQIKLNPNGINALRNFPNYGNVIWGARTVSQDPSWTYVSVRRLFIFVEQSVKNGLQWAAFEPNGQTLWAQVTRDIDGFLTTLWQQGAMFGATPSEAFFVVCDASNNPPETIAQGLLYVDIGLAPVYPAEFVVLRITQKTAAPA